MTSTESPNETTALARAIFHEIVIPLATTLRERGIDPLGQSTGTDSYFSDPLLPRMRPEDFETPAVGSSAAILDALAARWRTDGLEFDPLLLPLAELAARLEGTETAPDGELSTLKYVMY